jgi:hypothetical protein
LLVTASVVPSSPFLVTLIKEELSSSETSILIQRIIPEDAILQAAKLIFASEFSIGISATDRVACMVLHKAKAII